MPHHNHIDRFRADARPALLFRALAMQVEQLADPVLPVGEIVRRCPARQLMQLYKVPAYSGAEQFLQHVAQARGKLKKGGTVDVQVRRPARARVCWGCLLCGCVCWRVLPF
jgi:hypothetical protein